MATATSNDPIANMLDELFRGQESNIESAVRALKVLAHPARLKILCILDQGESTVQRMEEYTSVSQSNLSQHLSVQIGRAHV